MDRDFVHRNLRKLELLRHAEASLLEKLNSHPLESFQTRSDNAFRLHEAAKKLDEELSAYIVTQAKAECMTLSKMVQSKLPRELRDMVYTHLLPRETYLAWDSAPKFESLHSLHETSRDHLFEEGYLAFDTMKEIGELWYARSTFVDIWGLDIDVRQHVKHIYIRLDYAEDVHDKVTQLAANLQRLLSLRANVRVVLQLQCTYWPSHTLTGQEVVELVKKLRIVFPVLKKLVKGGKRVMVNVKGHDVFEVKVRKLRAPSWIRRLTKVLSDKDLIDLEP